MSIADRLFQSKQELSNKNLQEGQAFLEANKANDGVVALESGAPVSYTHLDVYKRQPLRIAAFTGKIKIPPPIGIKAAPAIACLSKKPLTR